MFGFDCNFQVQLKLSPCQLQPQHSFKLPVKLSTSKLPSFIIAQLIKAPSKDHKLLITSTHSPQPSPKREVENKNLKITKHVKKAAEIARVHCLCSLKVSKTRETEIKLLLLESRAHWILLRVCAIIISMSNTLHNKNNSLKQWLQSNKRRKKNVPRTLRKAKMCRLYCTFG
jgi:hypothetical protein